MAASENSAESPIGRSRRRRVVAAIASASFLGILLAGCALRIPTDPDGTLERVRGSVLRVGMVEEPGLIERKDGHAEGPLADLVDRFAARLDADVDWTSGGEETLVGELENGDLDLVVGGMTTDSPWSDRVALTRGYPGIPGAAGRDLCWFAPLGENAFVSEAEIFLDQEVGE